MDDYYVKVYQLQHAYKKFKFNVRTLEFKLWCMGLMQHFNSK